MRSLHGTDRVTGLLVRLVPSSLRSEFGDDMIQLACDRRRHGGEPLWRLWPSVAIDISSVALRLRWEEAMFPVRALLLGVGIAIAVLGILGGDPIVSLVVVLVMIGATRLIRPRERVPHGAAPHPWRWLLGGAVLCAAAMVALAVNGDRELTEPQWALVMGTMVLGFVALGTGAVLAVTAQAARRHGAGIAPPPPVS